MLYEIELKNYSFLDNNTLFIELGEEKRILDDGSVVIDCITAEKHLDESKDHIIVEVLEYNEFGEYLDKEVITDENVVNKAKKIAEQILNK